MQESKYIVSTEKLTELIKKSGKKQQHFADMCGIDNATIVRMRQGKLERCSMNTILNICDYCEIVDVRELMYKDSKY